MIVLSARSAEADKIEALDAGADAYLVKPFSVGELVWGLVSVEHNHYLRIYLGHLRRKLEAVLDRRVRFTSLA